MGKGRMPSGMGMPGMNMNNLMKQAQKMQQQMEEAQATVAQHQLEVTAGGGAIKVVVNGNKEIKSIELSKDIVDPEDIEMLQDLIISAVNEAIRQMEDYSQNVMGKITGGGIPGLM